MRRRKNPSRAGPPADGPGGGYFEELAEPFLSGQAAALHLEPYFNGMPLAAITGEAIAAYIRHRFGEKASLAAIRDELSALEGMYRRANAALPPWAGQAPPIPGPAELRELHEAWLKASPSIPTPNAKPTGEPG